MNLISAKTPRLAKLLLYNYQWDIKTDEKELFLTFDDGPTPEITEWVLRTLELYHAKATFFFIGKNIIKYPNILNVTIKAGHTIGNHTFSHKNGWQTNLEDYLLDVKKCNDALLSNTNRITSNYFRPPYGKITLSQSKNLRSGGYKILMWDVLAFDWRKNLTRQSCFENVRKNAEPGSIIVFHDSTKASRNMKFALPKTLEYFIREGYTFKSLP